MHSKRQGDRFAFSSQKSLNTVLLPALKAGWSADKKDTAGKTIRPQRTTAGAMGERFTYEKLGDSGGRRPFYIPSAEGTKVASL